MFFARSGWSLALSLTIVLVMVAPSNLASAGQPALHGIPAVLGNSGPSHSAIPGHPESFGHPQFGPGSSPRILAPHTAVSTWSWFNATPGLNGFQWVTHIDSTPPDVQGGAMAQYPIQNSSNYFDVLFGGYAASTAQVTNQTWIYIGGPSLGDPNYWYNITNASDAPPALVYASMTYDPNIPALVLFGGEYANGSVSDETWFLYTSNFTWVNQTYLSCFFFCPGARMSASMAFAQDSSDNDTILFGGCGDEFCASEFNDTWALINFTGTYVWIQLSETTAPSQRDSASMAYGGASVGAMVLFGGCDVNFNCGLNDTWVLYNSAWSNLTDYIYASGSGAPPGRYGAAMTYVVAWGELMLTGGQNDTVATFNDTWFFICSIGCLWENYTYLYPGLDVLYASVADTTYNGDPLVYGGVIASSYTPTNVTWEFQPSTQQNFSVSNLIPEIHQNISVNSTVLGGGPGDYEYQLWVWTLPGSGTWNWTASSEFARNISFPTAGTWYLNVTGLDQYDYTTFATYLVTVGAPGVTAHAASLATDVGVNDQFTSTPGGQYTTPLNYSWTFGDSGTATSQNAEHAYAAKGNYTATVMIEDGLNNTASQSVHITVNSRPTASITASAIKVETNQTVNLTSHVLNGTPAFTYYWDFGDASTASTSADTSHAYTAAGNYTVTLKVADAVGADANTTIVIDVVRALVASASANVTSAKVGIPIQFTATSSGGSGGTTYAWRFGDGASASTASASHAYAKVGSYTATVWVNDSAGTSIVKTVSVTVTSTGSTNTNSPSGSGSGIPSWVWVVVVIVILAGIIGAVMILRGRSKPPAPPPGPPAAWSEGPPATSTTTPAGPPPGAMGGSSPPGSSPPSS